MIRTKLLSRPNLSIVLPPVPVMVALVAVYLIWGSTYLGGAIALESYPPFMLVALRLLMATVVLLVILRVQRVALPSKREMLNAGIIGGLMFGGGAGLVSFAQQWVASGLASLAVAMVPIWASLFARLWGHRPSKLEVIGLGVGILGVTILNMEHGMQAEPLGALALLVGPMLWAFGSMWSKRLTMPRGTMATVFQMIGGGIVLMVMSVLNHEAIMELPTLKSTVALLYLAGFGTLVAFSAYMYLVRTVRPALATSYAYVNPMIAVVLGVVLAAEHITSVGVLAMVVILTGVVLVVLGKQEKAKNTA